MADPDETEASNIIFYASDEPFSFKTPTTREYQNPTFNTYFAVVAHFQQWEIFQDLRDEVIEMEVHQTMDAEEVGFATRDDKEKAGEVEGDLRVRVLTREDHGQRDFAAIHHETQEDMRQYVIELFPEKFWREFKPKTFSYPGSDVKEDDE